MFGATEPESLSVTGQSLRIHGKQDQKIVLHQGIQQGPSRLFQCQSHRVAAETQSQLGGPPMDGIRLLGQNQLFRPGLITGAQTDEVRLIAPVQANPGCTSN